jgi:DtxR family manganese transport transcriptional regulator
MGTALPEARRFGKARAAQSGARQEDYVEMIADLLAAGGEARTVELARRFGVSHAAVVKAVAQLQRAGLAVCRPYRGVVLTPDGAALAGRVRARHRVVLGALGVPEDAAEQDAEGIEHHVSDTTLDAFARFLRGR